MLKTTASGAWYIAPAQSLSLGLNTINVTAVSFNRSVKVHFSSPLVLFDRLALNGSDVY